MRKQNRRASRPAALRLLRGDRAWNLLPEASVGFLTGATGLFEDKAIQCASRKLRDIDSLAWQPTAQPRRTIESPMQAGSSCTS